MKNIKMKFLHRAENLTTYLSIYIHSFCKYINKRYCLKSRFYSGYANIYAL